MKLILSLLFSLSTFAFSVDKEMQDLPAILGSAVNPIEDILWMTDISADTSNKITVSELAGSSAFSSGDFLADASVEISQVSDLQAALDSALYVNGTYTSFSVDSFLSVGEGSLISTAPYTGIRTSSNGSLEIAWNDDGTQTWSGLLDSVGVLSNLNAINLTGVAQNLTAGSVKGVTAVVNATAGNVGENIEAFLSAGGAQTTATPRDIGSITLTPGDWDVEGVVTFSLTGASVTAMSACINTTSATMLTNAYLISSAVVTSGATIKNSIVLPRRRFNVGTTTTVYLIGSVTFTGTSVNGSGYINARRVR